MLYHLTFLSLPLFSFFFFSSLAAVKKKNGVIFLKEAAEAVDPLFAPVWIQFNQCFFFQTCVNSQSGLLVSADVFSQLRLHPLHGDAAQQGVLLRGQPDEGPDRADAAQLRDAAGAHLHAAARPLHPAAEGVAGQLTVSGPNRSQRGRYKKKNWAKIQYDEPKISQM